MIPFQLQLSYEAKNGSKVIRVITQQRPYTKDRKTAEKSKYSNCLEFLKYMRPLFSR